VLTTRRRIIAACASVLLIMGLVGWTSSPSQAVAPAMVAGRVVDTDGSPIALAKVTFYRSTDGVGAPWVYATSTNALDELGNAPGQVGTFSQQLEQGRYKILVEPDYTNGGRYLKNYYGDSTTIDGATTVDVVGTDQTLPDVTLEYAGGLISGHVTDIFDKPVAGVEVTSKEPPNGWPLDETLTDATGAYTVRAGAEAVSLEFLKTAAHLWSNPLQGLSAPAGQTLAGQDVVMKPSPLYAGTKPRITGILKVGHSLKVSGGSWIPRQVTRKYQWYEYKNAKTYAIRGATKSYYKLDSGDYGKRFRAKVTASYPTLTSKDAWSGVTNPVRHHSSITLSGSSPSKWTVKLSAKLKISDGVKASGRVTFRCGYLSKKVTLKKGKASATLRHVSPGKTPCEVSYAGTSKIAGSSKTKTIKIK
jgi:hypothetical protein